VDRDEMLVVLRALQDAAMLERTFQLEEDE
jgi:hypothetical protein